MGLNIAKAKNIKGWMWPQELEWLAKTAGKMGKIIEIGSYRGRSTRAMLDNSKAHIWCIDTWSTPDDGHTGVISEADYCAFKANVKDALERITILKMRSDEAAKQLLDLHGPFSFDMAFIDGWHSYASVKADILAYSLLVRRGGIVSGHDYGNITCHGVKLAVKEVALQVNVVGTIWWRIRR